jgi:Zn-dependent protease
MFKRNLRLFTLQNIPVEVNISWLFVLALVTWSFATGFYPESYPGRFGPVTVWVLSLLTALLLFLSILIHEFSHSIVASRGGLPIRRITLFIFGGVAQMGHEVDEPSLELRMAAAGPLMTLVLAGVFLGSSFLTGGVPFLSILLGTVGAINIGIFIFNMVPGFPLDGGRILRAIIWKRSGDMRKATRIAARVGEGFAWLLVGGGAVNFLVYGNYVSGIWMVFIGLFLRQAADRSYKQMVWKKSLAEIRVRDVMRREAPVADPAADLESLVEGFFMRFHLDSLPVASGGMLLGILYLDDVTAIDRSEWAGIPAGDVARSIDPASVARPDDPAWTLFVPLMQQGHGIIPVAGPDGRLAGVVTRRDYAALLEVRSSVDSRDRSPG